MGRGLRNWQETTGGLEGGRQETQLVFRGGSPRLLLIPTDQAPPVPPENPREELVGIDPWRNRANSLKSETAEGREPLDRERPQKGKDTEAEQGFMEKRGWDGELQA